MKYTALLKRGGEPDRSGNVYPCDITATIETDQPIRVIDQIDVTNVDLMPDGSLEVSGRVVKSHTEHGN